MSAITDAISRYNKEGSRLIDIIRDVQEAEGCVTESAVAEIARGLGMSPVDVRGVVSFYHFFSDRPRGQYAVYLNNNPVAFMMGRSKTSAAFERETGIAFGGTTADGKIGLYDTSCIGMNDQEPSAIINGHVFTGLTEDRVAGLVKSMKKNLPMGDILKDYYGSSIPSTGLVAGVSSNIRQKGKVVFADYVPGSGLKKALAMKPVEVIEAVKNAGLRGRGGAGFPTGMKWNFCNMSEGDARYVLCNCDEGEPGTFKDRVILTEEPRRLFEGMAIAGYALQSAEGIIYIRAEYIYLKEYLEGVLADMKDKKLLGSKILDSGFTFNISIKFGAGAYICGEESALIESAEGKRGEPRNRPPFPVQNGYMGQPTTVNNVETYCNVPVILEKGAEWFTGIGSGQTTGTKVLSISGDCARPGIYEVDYGTTLEAVLDLCGGKDAMAVQVGGPSGQCVGKSAFGRQICFSDLSTGGSIIVIGKERDLLEVVYNFMEFFVEESCGWCVPCRAGNVILRDKLEKIMSGKASQTDLDEIRQWGETVKAMSRCGLGQTSPNSIITTLDNFPEVYQKRIQSGKDYVTSFDMAASVMASCNYVGRKPVLEE